MLGKGTITVKELKEALSQFDDDARIGVVGYFIEQECMWLDITEKSCICKDGDCVIIEAEEPYC